MLNEYDARFKAVTENKQVQLMLRTENFQKPKEGLIKTHQITLNQNMNRTYAQNCNLEGILHMLDFVCCLLVSFYWLCCQIFVARVSEYDFNPVNMGNIDAGINVATVSCNGL